LQQSSKVAVGFGMSIEMREVMKTRIVFFVSLIWMSTMQAQTKPAKANVDNLPNQGFRNSANYAFMAGEQLTYRIHYGFVDAGTATLKVEDSPYSFAGRPAYKVVGTGRSEGSVDWFFKVRDHYETHIDKEGMFPYRFLRNCDEGGYRIQQDYTFFPERRAFKNIKGEGYKSPEFVQDMLSAYYYARTLNYSYASVGDIFTITTLVDDEIYPLRMKYIGKETITIDAGTFRCMKFVPVLQKGRVFKQEHDLTVWITDDLNHIPVLAEAQILVGSIKMELKEYFGVRNALALQ
jgi:hypothetical protein